MSTQRPVPNPYLDWFTGAGWGLTVLGVVTAFALQQGGWLVLVAVGLLLLLIRTVIKAATWKNR